MARGNLNTDATRLEGTIGSRALERSGRSLAARRARAAGGAGFAGLLTSASRHLRIDAASQASAPSASAPSAALSAAALAPASFGPATSQGVGGMPHAAAPNALLRLPNELGPIVAEAAQKYGVDPALIAGVIECESNFNPRAGSPAGAKGLMQLMDGTARGLGVTDSFDARQNVLGGTKFLRQMLDKYKGDAKLALAAYNAGPGAVDRYGGVPPYAETQRYVPKVLAATERYRAQAGPLRASFNV